MGVSGTKDGGSEATVTDITLLLPSEKIRQQRSKREAPHEG